MSIRKVGLKDKSKLKELANKYLVPLYGDVSKQIRGWLTGYGYKHAWVYETNKGEIAGIVAVSDKPNKEYIKISTLVVDEDHRRKGIGEELLEKALDYAYNTRKKEISVTVGEDITNSLNFFYKNGFVLKSELKEKYRKGKKELVLVRALKPRISLK